MTFTSFLAVSATSLAVLLSPAMAADPNSGQQQQTRSRIQNEIKAFAYDWYARFDKGTTVEALAPNLAEENLEFVFPQAILKSMEELKPAFEQSWSSTTASAHEIEEIFVHPTNEADLYDVVTPHRYYIKGKDGSSRKINIVSRMKVRTGLETKLDPDGDLPKIEKYMAIFENVAQEDVAGQIASLRKGALTHSDVKSFVHKWYSKTDAKDANALLELTSDAPLNFNLLGTEISNKEQLGGYFAAVDGAQAWAAHQAHNISITNTDDGFAVRFIVHFEGDVQGAGLVRLSNVTNWLLVEENGELRLRDYTLKVL